MKIKSNFSQIYHALIPNFLEIEVVEEKLADCLNCHCSVKPSHERFDTKCCDYHPSIPNYVIGAILSDQSAALKGPQAIIRDKIAQKKGVTPYGIAPSAAYQKSFKDDRANKKSKNTTAEHRRSLLCPFFDTGMCTIHKYRADICGSFFCQSVSSEEGKQLSKKVQSFSKNLDYKLSLHITDGLRPDLGDLAGIDLLKDTSSLIENENNSIDNNYESLWSEWLGREEDYYKQCYSRIQDLSPQNVNDILGTFLTNSTEEIQRSAKIAHDNITPAKLFYNEEKYHQWLESQGIAVSDNSLEKHLLKSFNGQRNSQEIILKIRDVDFGFSTRISTYIRHDVLSEEKL
jgi:Fe-S-cluster containining protein